MFRGQKQESSRPAGRKLPAAKPNCPKNAGRNLPRVPTIRHRRGGISLTSHPVWILFHSDYDAAADKQRERVEMMTEIMWLAGGAVVGAIIGWLLASLRAQSNQSRDRSETAARLSAAENSTLMLREQLTAREKNIESLQHEVESRGQEVVRRQSESESLGKRLAEQERVIREMETRLKESFGALSAEALQANAQQFLAEASKTLGVVLAEAKGDLGKREEAIKGLVQPVAESLRQYESHIKEIERSRQAGYGTLQEQLRQLSDTHRSLQAETGRLVNALRDPKVRGRWGELALRRTVELAGMAERCDFDQQVSFENEEARQRPDLLVHLPGGRSIAVDAKAVLDAYLDAVAATDETIRAAQLKRHAMQVRSRMKELGGKTYWDRLGSSPEFVVLFLPGEAFFSAALEADPTLIEDAIGYNVILASPTTLIALLRAIAHGWRQAQMIENADRISALGRELYERLRTFLDHMVKLGGNLGSSVDTYNKALASLESRVLPSGRKMSELGAGSGDELPSGRSVDQMPRIPQSLP